MAYAYGDGISFVGYLQQGYAFLAMHLYECLSRAVGLRHAKLADSNRRGISRMHIGGRLVGGLFGSWLLLLARAASVSALLVEPPGPRGKKPAPGSLRVFAHILES